MSAHTHLRLLRAASRLNVWLRENVGDTADWPVRLQCSDVATADALACLLSELGSEVQAILEHGADAQTAASAPERSAASAPSDSITGDIVHVGDIGPQLTGIMVRIDREKLKAFHANLAYATVTITPDPRP